MCTAHQLYQSIREWRRQLWDMRGCCWELSCLCVLQVRDMADGSAIWIAKPSITNQAIGICIFDRVSTLRSALEAAEDMREWVVQRRVSAPDAFSIPMADVLHVIISAAHRPHTQQIP